MKLHILSDLHNEFLKSRKIPKTHLWHGEIPETDADIIILAGDVDVGLNGVKWAVNESERLRKPVIYVLGNHEFYRHEYYSLKQQIKDHCRDTDVHLLDCGTLEFENVRLLGLTLWTDYRGDPAIPRDLAMFHAGKNLADHHLIQIKNDGQYCRFKPEHALALHESEKNWLNNELDKPCQGKTVVISHHGPHAVCDHPDYPDSPFGTAFYSNLDALIADHTVDLWIFGHTHSNIDTLVYNTRIVSNQAGYPGEGVKQFDPGFIIDV